MATKESLRRLVEKLPDSELDHAQRYLEYLRNTADPFFRKLLEAPEDDEELTDEDLTALQEMEEDMRAGRVAQR